MNSVEICNLALNMLGIPAITSFDDANNNAKLCKQFFPVLRDRVLRDHNWSFATASYELQALDKVSFDPEFEYVCALPGDLIRVLEVADNIQYRRAGDEIFVDLLPATLVYIRRVEDASKFDVTFTEALQYALAAELGMANTRDTQLISMYRQEYERRLAVARSIDSSENRFENQNAPQRSSWIAARFRGGVPCHGRTSWVEGTEGRQN